MLANSCILIFAVLRYTAAQKPSKRIKIYARATVLSPSEVQRPKETENKSTPTVDKGKKRVKVIHKGEETTTRRKAATVTASSAVTQSEQ
ncbi:hypothetical protein BDB00DRAFT_873784 [Zychaea mexicana]|uniref:uncharacterized protein n=1 Tax=Zychaea mexicana TaxID=64656 RepID=UPI0022FF255D|nr:uncharacterized protein BDB00DRAFT_873784 [Zychaea mexicana]KAI9491949.1 hypothetical protein BDB00DRAFT_873784 [Zychaea mexicana]